MQEKEKKIIIAGMKLFAKKGFSSTSIQEIATESEISKGAFYLHFKSKDDLLLAIMEYIFKTVNSNISIYENQNLPPREKFIKQLTTVFGTFIDHKEFFIMLNKEQAIPRNDDIKRLFFKKHYENHLFYRRELISIYGKEIEPFSIDLALILEGLYQSYTRLVTFEPLDYDMEELTQFLMRRMDSMVKDIIMDEPFLKEDKIYKFLSKTSNLFDTENINTIVNKMKEEIDQLENNEDFKISIEVLEEEIKRENPRIPIIKGMLSNFEDIESLELYRKAIASFYGIR